jgi:hypothetical protein
VREVPVFILSFLVAAHRYDTFLYQATSLRSAAEPEAGTGFPKLSFLEQ